MMRGIRGSAEGVPPRERLSGDVPFVAVTTALLALFGWLAGHGSLPWFRRGEGSLAATFSARGRTFLGAWLGTLAVCTVILPLASALLWRRDEGVKRTMIPYALVLLFQIATEAAFSRLFFPNIVAFVGLTYTPYRMRQIQRARQVLGVTGTPVRSGRRPVRVLATVGLILWTVNLIFLLVGALPRVVGSGRERSEGGASMSPAERALYRMLNPVVRLVLRSPANGLLGNRVMLLSFYGRKSGKRYAVPVGYVLDGEDILCLTGRSWGNWWRNLAGGTPVEVRLRGRGSNLRAGVVEDEAVLERGLGTFLRKYPSTARRYGVRLDPGGSPESEDLAEAARGGEVVMILIRANP